MPEFIRMLEKTLARGVNSAQFVLLTKRSDPLNVIWLEFDSRQAKLKPWHQSSSTWSQVSTSIFSCSNFSITSNWSNSRPPEKMKTIRKTTLLHPRLFHVAVLSFNVSDCWTAMQPRAFGVARLAPRCLSAFPNLSVTWSWNLEHKVNCYFSMGIYLLGSTRKNPSLVTFLIIWAPIVHCRTVVASKL